MASDLSSGCDQDIEIFEEKEEGEISLEDVSSSEESHPTYRTGFRTIGECPRCMSLQGCAAWCVAARAAARTARSNRDAVYGKENRRHVKDAGALQSKHAAATLQEKNDDFVPISSDSDMELVGMPGNSKQRAKADAAKVRRKRKKKRSRGDSSRTEDATASGPTEKYVVDAAIAKKTRSSRPHRRETSPSRRRTTLERPVVESTLRRYRKIRSAKSRSPGRRSGSPSIVGNSTERKSPRKLRSSPRRSPIFRSPARSGQQFVERSPGSVGYVDTRATRLLKKVRRLETVGTGSKKNSSRSKEHSSLKEKLNNMMKNQAEASNDKPRARKRRDNAVPNNNNNDDNKNVNGGSACGGSDDEEDVELLRRLALETKQKKCKTTNDEPESRETVVAIGDDSDDNDIDPNQLRILALRSAIMKKHQRRIARGVKSGKPTKPVGRVESPFNESFLEEIYISDDDNSSVKSPITASVGNDDDDGNRLVDMDIDTDVEREKDIYFAPYSPTDDVTAEISLRASSPGRANNENQDATSSPTSKKNISIVEQRITIEPSDSTVDLEIPHALGEPTIVSNCQNSLSQRLNDDRNVKNVRTDTENSSTSENNNFADVKISSCEIPNVDDRRSPFGTTETRNIDERTLQSRDNENPEVPYSPTDKPLLDPELFPIFPNLPIPPAEIDDRSKNPNDDDNSTIIERTNSSASKNFDSAKPMEFANEIATFNVDTEINSQSSRYDENNEIPSKNDERSAIASTDDFSATIDVADKLPEVDLDGSLLVSMSDDVDVDVDAVIVTPIEIVPEIIDGTDEPLYLRCLSDIAKETNKITGIASRTLVPAHILKTNKQLQQPLPVKKIDPHPEPSFKSAEMLPVTVETLNVKSSTSFKPIKLCPISKKSQVTTTAAAVFNTSFGDDSTKEPKEDNVVTVIDDVSATSKEPKTTTTTTATTIVESPIVEKSQKTDERSESKKKSNGRTEHRRERLRDVRRPSTTAKSPNRSKKIGVEEARPSNSTDSSNNKSRPSSSSSLENLEKLARKGSRDKRTIGQRDPTLANDRESGAIDTTIGNGGNRKKKSPRQKQKARQKRRNRSRVSSIDGSAASELEVTKDVTKMDDERGDNEEIEIKKDEEDAIGARKESTETIETAKKRRCSLDEDEEALRAQLLASLPKRPKPVEATFPTNPPTTTSQISDSKPNFSSENNGKKIIDDSMACPTKSVLKTVVNASPTVGRSANVVSAMQNTAIVVSADATKNSELLKKNIVNETNVNGFSLSPRKRPNPAVVKGPPKKIVKKPSPVLASTKVVNNAKKYQNALLQKKLQRATTVYGTQNGSRNITLNNLKNNDGIRPSSPKISAGSKMKQFIINLGSDTDSENESDERPSKSTEASAITTEVRKPLTIPATDFEKSVEQFLKDQRKKQEAITDSKSSTNFVTSGTKVPTKSVSPAIGKLSGLDNTPLAVRRHLPMSQQEEYRRLKQQIMDHERQKRQKTMENGATSQPATNKFQCTPPGPLSPASPIAGISKSQTNPQISKIANQTSTTMSPTSKENQIIDNSTLIKRITKINVINDVNSVAKIGINSKPYLTPIPIEQLKKSVASSSSSLQNNISKNPTNSVFSKIPTKTLLEKNSDASIAKIMSITSTPKVQTSIVAKNRTGLTSKGTSPVTKIVQSTMDNRFKVDKKTSTILTTDGSVKTSTNISTRDKERGILGTISGSVSSSTRTPTSGRSSLIPTEMLTIQIPNDKLKTDRSTMEITCHRENSSSPIGRSVGVTRIHPEKGTNGRFVKIQVQRGQEGRRVTVEESSPSRDEASRTIDSSTISKISSSSRIDNEKNICCDISLNTTENTTTTIMTKKSGESMIGGSDESTLLLSRNEKNFCNDEIVDSEVSTICRIRGNSLDEDSGNSEASTVVLDNDKSVSRGSPGTTRTDDCEEKTCGREMWEKIRSDVKNELELLGALPIDQQRNILIESQNNLVAKRNMVLDDLMEMSGCLRRMDVEREIQTQLMAEVHRLREQLATAEKHMHEQRRQMNGMSSKVTKVHEKINHNRRECYKLSGICHGLGNRIIGEDYKIPDDGAELVHERLKEVAVHTRQLSKKKVPPIGSLNDSRDVSSSSSSSVSSIGKNVTSENSSIERTSNATPFITQNTCIDVTKDSPTNDNRIDDFESTNKNSEAFAITIEDSKKSKISNEISKESSEENIVDVNARLSSTTKNLDETKDDEKSQPNETVLPIAETESSEPTETNGTTKKTECSKFIDREANEGSEIATIASNDDRAEDFYAPGPSNSDCCVRLSLLDEPTAAETKIDDYKSVLTHFKSSRSVNPDGILCPYELMGTCSDGDCQFFHLNPEHCQ